MSSEVKLFRLCGSAPVIDMRTGHNATLRSGLVVLSEDAHTNALAALEAECERLRGTMMEVVTKNFAKNLERAAKHKELDYYLSEGIRQLQAERDALAAELAAIKGRQPVAFYWQDIGYPEPRTHGPYFGQPSESALCNVDGGAIPVPLYTLPAAPEGGEV